MVYHSYDVANDRWYPTPITHVECQQIGLQFCGDGVVDSKYGEQCDKGDSNGKGKCSSTCKIVR